MIFVTVGHLNPFDRLAKAMDTWSSEHQDVKVFAQIGDTNLKPEHMEWSNFLEPTEFRKRVEACDAMVSHAGMGSILTAMELGKPILIVPRHPEEGAQNNHQFASARAFTKHEGILAVMSDEEFDAKLEMLQELAHGNQISPVASESLISAIRAAIDE